MKKIVVIIFLTLILVGCAKSVDFEETSSENIVSEELEEEVIEPEVEEEITTVESCNDSRECKVGEDCIDNTCTTIEALYKTECTQKCNFKQVEILTSDGENYILNRGESSYTSAGALAWKLLRGPDYCPGEEVIVPIELEKINYGDILNTQIVTVKVGETSDVITHPTSKRVKFTLTVESVNEVCS